MIDKAFILAAGRGTRMKPLTDRLPKPLAEVAGRSLLERSLEHLRDAGVSDVVINTHHLADQIEAKINSYLHPSPRRGEDKGGGALKMDIHLSHEPRLLDTGGGIYKALQHFQENPFYVLSGDGLWTDGAHENALRRLAKAWDPEVMDILMLLQPVSVFALTEGIGDYDLLPDGRARRSPDKTGTHMFTSIRINHPRIFANAPHGAFSYLTLLDAAQQAGRLYGLEHDGEWHHISTMENLAAVDAVFTRKKL